MTQEQYKTSSIKSNIRNGEISEFYQLEVGPMLKQSNNFIIILNKYL
jgi:hypothetical protein